MRIFLVKSGTLMLTGFGIYTYTCQTNFPTCPANDHYFALINWSLHLQFCAEVSWELLIDLLGLFLNQKWNYVKTHYRHFWKNEFLQLVLNYWALKKLTSPLIGHSPFSLSTSQPLNLNLYQPCKTSLGYPAFLSMKSCQVRRKSHQVRMNSY